ncbi:hypothetical protein [Cohnella panacarvi]|uniref:hypothetical protein n=1 Tax=Cohnella panacarvi TaxID=400776 RepID=UPI000478C84F|nr:hypothetical protein [Cohnella panacarvi]
MAAQGYDWNEFCEAAAIDPDLALDAEARLPTEDYERAVNTAVRVTGDDVVVTMELGIGLGRTGREYSAVNFYRPLHY